MSSFKISGNIGDFRIVVETRYYINKIKNNATTLHLFQCFEGTIIRESKWLTVIQYHLNEENANNSIGERNTFSDLICFLKQFKIKYTLAMGPVILNKIDDTAFILKGYLKPNLIKAIAPFDPLLQYTSNNEEYYLFKSKKLHNIITLLNKHSVAFTDQTVISPIEENKTSPVEAK